MFSVGTRKKSVTELTKSFYFFDKNVLIYTFSLRLRIMFSLNTKNIEASTDSTPVEISTVIRENENAYFLVKVKSGANYFTVLNKFNSLDNVKQSFASKGEAEIILIVEKTCDKFSFSDLETKLISVDEVSNVSCLKVTELYSISKEAEAVTVSSLLIMLVDDAKLVDIAKELLRSKCVNVCYAVNGKYNLIVELCFSSFAETDKFISNYAATINGVFKVKKLPLIKLYE
ncbi:MAG: hypothetical protein FD143_1896 [Ignavibacteria bacterium]|nr:MAG: hypothetical protein FD143_1896 [Ignavibacteria bacterium]KAF0159949.1 MAG: hypothetical protein FD188_2074 [Ignavibacteria bacterium]